MTVRALEYYSKEIGPHSEKANQIFQELRGNIVKNVFNQYKKTGFIWENYNQDTGRFLMYITLYTTHMSNCICSDELPFPFKMRIRTYTHFTFMQLKH